MNRISLFLFLTVSVVRPLTTMAQGARQADGASSGELQPAKQNEGDPAAIEVRGAPPKGKQVVAVRVFKTNDFVKLENPTPGVPYRPEILTADQGAKNIGGMFGLLVPGSQVPYHYHVNRESVIIAISGEATEVIEGKEMPIQAGDVFYIPAGKKHTTINRSDRDFRYLEFFTFPPMASDFVEVK